MPFVRVVCSELLEQTVLLPLLLHVLEYDQFITLVSLILLCENNTRMFVLCCACLCHNNSGHCIHASEIFWRTVVYLLTFAVKFAVNTLLVNLTNLYDS